MSEPHIEHLLNIVRSLAVSDEGHRTLRALAADGVVDELRRAIDAAREQGRRDGLEEAARVCDEQANAEFTGFIEPEVCSAHRMAGLACAAEIRNIAESS